MSLSLLEQLKHVSVRGIWTLLHSTIDSLQCRRQKQTHGNNCNGTADCTSGVGHLQPPGGWCLALHWLPPSMKKSKLSTEYWMLSCRAAAPHEHGLDFSTVQPDILSDLCCKWYESVASLCQLPSRKPCWSPFSDIKAQGLSFSISWRDETQS